MNQTTNYLFLKKKKKKHLFDLEMATTCNKSGNYNIYKGIKSGLWEECYQLISLLREDNRKTIIGFATNGTDCALDPKKSPCTQLKYSFLYRDLKYYSV